MLYMAMCRVYGANGLTVLYQSISATATDVILLDVNAIRIVVEDFVSLTQDASFELARVPTEADIRRERQHPCCCLLCNS
jgi:hypothetical protein